MKRYADTKRKSLRAAVARKADSAAVSDLKLRLIEAERQLAAANERAKAAEGRVKAERKRAELAERRADELERLANTDTLTGLPNRRGFDAYLETMRGALSGDIEQAIEAETVTGGIAFIDFDIDNFKRVNDVLGHEVGDAILVAVADAIQKTVRVKAKDKPDSRRALPVADKVFHTKASRQGGEEFRIAAFVGYHNNSRWALVRDVTKVTLGIISRLMNNIKREPVAVEISLEDFKKIQQKQKEQGHKFFKLRQDEDKYYVDVAVTISVGFSIADFKSFLHNKKDYLKEIVGTADQALYAAKGKGGDYGRNRMAYFPEPGRPRILASDGYVIGTNLPVPYAPQPT